MERSHRKSERSSHESSRRSSRPPKYAFHPAARLRRALAAGLLGLAAGAAVALAEHHNDAVPRQANAPLAGTIPLHDLGYIPPGAALLLERIAGTTLNFIDGDRLLFTFHQPGLMKRESDAQPDDDDQLIRADVVNIVTGKIETSTTWRMHDRARYLWPLSAGRFLVRQRDTLFSTDALLELKPFAQFPGLLRSVQLSPGGKILVAETEEAPPKHASTAAAARPSLSQSAESQPAESQPPGMGSDEGALPVVVRIFNLETKTLVAQTRSRVVPRIPIIETGYLEALRASGDHWLVNFKRFDDHSQKIAEVASACSPDLQFLSPTVAMISSCDRSLKGRLLTAVTLDGKVLWDRRTDGHRIWPALTYAADGSRFAIETLVLNHLVSATEPFDREDVLGQLAEVFNTNGGESVLVAPASPVLDSGQNFALSADGRRFAILHNDAIEIYDLK